MLEKLCQEAGVTQAWGYERLHEAIEKRALAEMRHAEKLIERLLLLEGSSTVSKLNQIFIGSAPE